jgi:broad specificity phosphatase PhoE
MLGVSALMCPATLVVARHGDTEYVDTFFSDEGGTLTRRGRAEAAALADEVADRRVAHVWCSDLSRAVQTAEIVAGVLGVGVTTRKGLREIAVGDLTGQPFSIPAMAAVTDHWFHGDFSAAFPGGESGAEVISRYAETLEEIADLHRGETVVVVAHQTATCIALPSLAGNTVPSPADRDRRDAGAVAELVIDGDDWALTRWGGLPTRRSG